jgi:hypothetical protein
MAFPYALDRKPFTNPFFWFWYGILGFFAAWWIRLFLKNPRFTMRIRDGMIVWEDGLDPKASGSIDCAAIKAVRIETHEGVQEVWTRVYLVLPDKKIQLPNNCLPDLEKLLKELRSVNPRILKQEESR